MAETALCTPATLALITTLRLCADPDGQVVLLRARLVHRQLRAFRGGETTILQPAVLDPLSLVNNKALQATTLLPYRPPAENNGLSTATLALG